MLLKGKSYIYIYDHPLFKQELLYSSTFSTRQWNYSNLLYNQSHPIQVSTELQEPNMKSNKVHHTSEVLKAVMLMLLME
jgi:hypothetical protein